MVCVCGPWLGGWFPNIHLFRAPNQHPITAVDTNSGLLIFFPRPAAGLGYRDANEDLSSSHPADTRASATLVYGQSGVPHICYDTFPTTYCLSRIFYDAFPTTHFLWHISYDTFPTAHFLLSISNDMFPTTNFLRHLSYDTFLTTHFLRHISRDIFPTTPTTYFQRHII